MPFPVLLAWLAWLACCTTTGSAQTVPPVTRYKTEAVDLSEIGILPKGASAAEEAAIDTNGAAHVERVFLHRFSHELGNSTLRSQLEAALDVVLSAPEHLHATFSRAPSSAELLRDATSGSAAATGAISAAKSLGAAAGSSNPLDAKATLAALLELSNHASELSPGSCHPITRRIVLAALTRLQLRLHTPGLPFELLALRSNPETARLLFRTYRQLFNKHRQGAAVKGAVEFLHVSKSGGTSMCSVADRNGCVAESTTNYGNCMVRRFDDRPRWVSAAEHNRTAPLDGWRWYYRYHVRRGERSCEYRDEFVRRRGFTFYSNEFAAHGGLEPAPGEPPAAAPPWASSHVCPHFLNVLMLRHPLTRLVSHLRWIIKVYRTEYGRSYEPFFRGRDADYWRRFAPAAVDNYYTRLLLGESVFYAPTGSLNATHLAAARLLLLQYDVVLLLEASDMDELWLKMALGWRAGLASARARVAGHHRSATELMPYDTDELLEANGVDVALYEFGAAVHQLDGLMFASVAAAGLHPYAGFEEVNETDAEFGTRVRCGYATRMDELLAAVGENVTVYGRSYATEFARVAAPDERRKVAGGATAGGGASEK